MNYNIIGSSSKGNCIIVENVLMLDCGVTYVKIKKHLKDVKLIFISHIHKDHLLPSTVKKIAYNKPNIKFICGSKEVVQKLVDCGVKKKNIYLLNEGIRYDLGLLKVRLVYLFHDVSNFGLKWEIKGKKGIYLIDTEKVEHIVAQDYDLYLIEANYKQEILEKHLKECLQEEKIYLERVPKTHLSWNQANTFLIENMGKNSEFQYIHESTYNFEGDE